MAPVQTETVTIRKGSSSATLHLFGATLTSWKPNGIEALFVSEKSFFDEQKPIRGGVPVIFPHFGPWEHGPQHGFARRIKWTVKGGMPKNDSSSVTLMLEDNEDTRNLWNYRFCFEYNLTLVSESQLKMDAVITNRDEDEFNFTFLLHTYFQVPDVRNCTISGLRGCTYIDKVNNGAKCFEENEHLKLSQFTDRIYQNTALVNTLTRASDGRSISIQKSDLPDTVVWNPWTEKAKEMGDFGDNEWEKMICVEAGYVSEPYHLISGDSYKASQILKVL